MRKTGLFFALALGLGLTFCSIEGKAQVGPGMMGWEHPMGWFWPMPIIMLALSIAVVVAIIFLIRWLVVSAGATGRGAKLEDSAFDILKKRYARGEINKAEFEEKKKDLV